MGLRLDQDLELPLGAKLKGHGPLFASLAAAITLIKSVLRQVQPERHIDVARHQHDKDGLENAQVLDKEAMAIAVDLPLHDGAFAPWNLRKALEDELG